ncbi:MAG TPA: peroxiredoxin-like family protein [Myxococcota bacterium]|nr:peroxiredoxin-like family protein [Myxococcota bacterium]
MRWVPGAELAPRELVALSGDKLRIPDPERVVHLQLRRFAGCPICSLHLRSFALRRDEVAAAGVREVVVFHSPARELLPHASELRFDVIPDPERQLYTELGVESSARALLDPRAWPGVARALTLGTLAILRGQARPPALRPQGGRLGLPGDFLIAPGGRVLACKYGEHADDQWSVDELLSLVPAR